MEKIKKKEQFLLEENNNYKEIENILKKKNLESFCDAKVFAFVSIGILTAFYVIAELGVGLYLHSLVLLSDGFHNLSDVISLYIAYWAQQAQKRDISDTMSYGWVRSEILGGLTNGCFLLSLCLYVALEAIPKFIQPEPIESGMLFIIIASSGVGVNTIGTIIFAITGQGHSHSHSHGHNHAHSHKEKKKKKESGEIIASSEEIPKKKKKKKKKKDLNIQAVFLHYLGDAISSLMVLVAGILIHFFKGKRWVLYIDPFSSLIIIGLILWTTLPLVKRCSMILLQSTPNEIEMELLRQELIKVEGVISIHDFHVWQLVDGMIISSIHLAVEEGVDFTHIVSEVKRIFHDYGIHSSAIQPEFVPRNYQDTQFCEQNCVKECTEDWCCKKTADKRLSMIEEYSIQNPL